jgi:hypothetical protein
MVGARIQDGRGSDSGWPLAEPSTPLPSAPLPSTALPSTALGTGGTGGTGTRGLDSVASRLGNGGLGFAFARRIEYNQLNSGNQAGSSAAQFRHRKAYRRGAWDFKPTRAAFPSGADFENRSAKEPQGAS